MGRPARLAGGSSVNKAGWASSVRQSISPSAYWRRYASIFWYASGIWGSNRMKVGTG